MGLHLGIPQDVLDGIDVNERHDRPYKMLLRWRSTTDTDTPYCDLCRALCDEKVGLVNVAKQFCLEETTGMRCIFLHSFYLNWVTQNWTTD